MNEFNKSEIRIDMLHRHRSRGNEAKSACGKSIANTSTSCRIGAIASAVTLIIFLSVIITFIIIPSSSSQRHSPHIVWNNIRGRQHLNENLPNDNRMGPPVKKIGKQRFHVGVIDPEPVVLSSSDDHPKLFTSDHHIYTSNDIPYFNESVKEFRSRLSPLMSHIRPRTIFVSLASFRDDLCPMTLIDLFNKADYPFNITVGLVDQVNLETESACDSTLDVQYRSQVRLVRVPSSEGAGPTHARYIASKLYEGEEFFFQIDSHSRFADGWDTLVMDQVDRLPNPSRGIISHYPPPHDSDFNDPNIDWICCVKQHADAPPGLFITLSDYCTPDLRAEGIALRPGNSSPTSCVTPFIGGGMLIGRGQWVIDVPFDKYIPYLFHGEELLVSSRLWTSGWDIFSPSDNIVDHKYGGRDKNVYAESSTWGKTCELSQARTRYLLKTSLPGDDQLGYDDSEIYELGMGTVRSYEEYLQFAGIDLRGNSTGRCGQRYDWLNKRWLGTPKPMGT